jgi:tetratricopeptide (TPR) repeat protein
MNAATGSRIESAVLAAAFGIVLLTYAAVAGTAGSELGSRTASEDYYNRLADGLAHGHLYLDLAVPPALAQLPNPYDAAANAPFHGQMYEPGRIHDLSYFHGRFYLYFSAIPAVALFLPFHALTGRYLSHQAACAGCCGLGFLASGILILSIRRVCFPRAGPAAAAVAVLCTGWVPLVLVVLQRPDVWEVAITASYAGWMGALLALWACLGMRDRVGWAAVAASIAVGVAIGSRPNSCLGAAILLLPLWRLRTQASGPTAGATLRLACALLLPAAAIGGGVLGYNYARFGDPFEFGQRYQLTQEPEGLYRHFQPDFLGYNVRAYFLEHPGWQRGFPFVRDAPASAMPAGHIISDHPVGVLALLPFLLCALALPFGWSHLGGAGGPRLRSLVVALLWTFLAAALPLCLYFASCLRYELEFTPALALLAVIGWLRIANAADTHRWGRRLGVAAAGATALVSIGFNFLTAANHRSDAETQHAFIARLGGRTEEATGHYRRALRLRPANEPAMVGLADLRVRAQDYGEAVTLLQRAERLDPESPTLHLNAAFCLYQLHRWDEALAECAEVLRLRPDLPAAREAQREISLARARAP